MSFLTPTFLIASGAALLPILYHLIRRMRARKVMFSSLLFLRATPKALVKRRRLRDILLLIVRACILGLLAFAFARPFFPRESLPVVLQESDTSTVILLDNSYSMQYGDRFEQAKGEALGIIGDAGPADEIAVVAFSDHAEQISELTGDFTLLRNVVNTAVTAGNRTTDLYQPFRLAQEILRSARNERHAIVLISDFQAGGWNNRLENWRTDAGTAFTPVRIGDDRIDNSYINQLVIEQRRIGDAESAQFRLQVQSQGAGEDRDREVSLWMNNRELGTKTAEAVQSRQLFFQEDDLREGDYQGYVALDDDNLNVDNYRYFTFAVAERPSIVDIDGSPVSSRSNAFFLANTFSMGDRSLYDFSTAGPERLTASYLRGQDAVFLTNAPSLTSGQLAALRDYVESGGSLIISFGDRINLAQSSRTLDELGVGTLSGQVDVRQERAASAIVGDVDIRHPVFSVFSASGTGDLSRARFRRYVTVVPDSASVVVASYDTGDPFLVERLLGDGKVLVMTSSFNTEWSDFPVNDVFLPFVYQLVKYALSSADTGRMYTVGDQVPFYGAAGDEWEVRTPDGRIIRVTVDAEGAGWFRDTDSLGNYQAAHGSDQRFFSVNVDTGESDLAAKDEAEVYAAVTGRGDRTEAGTATAGMADSVDDENHQKVWRYVLLVIIGLFMLETYLANRRMSLDFGKNTQSRSR